MLHVRVRLSSANTYAKLFSISSCNFLRSHKSLSRSKKHEPESSETACTFKESYPSFHLLELRLLSAIAFLISLAEIF